MECALSYTLSYTSMWLPIEKQKQNICRECLQILSLVNWKIIFEICCSINTNYVLYIALLCYKRVVSSLQDGVIAQVFMHIWAVRGVIKWETQQKMWWSYSKDKKLLIYHNINIMSPLYSETPRWTDFDRGAVCKFWKGKYNVLFLCLLSFCRQVLHKFTATQLTK